MLAVEERNEYSIACMVIVYCYWDTKYQYFIKLNMNKRANLMHHHPEIT